METRNTLQNRLFHESPEDALTTDVLAAGGYKKVGHHLRPDLTPEQAAAWLRACLNVERNEKLSPGQVMQIKSLALQAGSYATVTYEAQCLGFNPQWIDGEEEAQDIERQNNDLLRLVLENQQRAERARARSKPAIPREAKR